MKSKIATSLLLLLVLTGFRPPQKNATDKNPLTLDKPLSSDHSLLWQISGNGLSKPSYLYGTIHMISRDDYFLGKNVSKKLGKSEALVMELNMEDMDIAALTKLSLLDSGKSIRNYMSDTDYNALQTFMEDSIGIKKFTFEMFYSKLKPFYLEQLIFFKYLGQEKESYEDNFKKMAEQKNIPVLGLETFEEQLRFLDEIPMESQLKSIIKTIGNYSAEIHKMDELIKNYKTQNLPQLSKLFSEDDDLTLKTNLLDKRNDNWVPKLKSEMQSRVCFIAVGAGHLGGENGLINLLKKEGYSVEPISTN